MHEVVWRKTWCEGTGRLCTKTNHASQQPHTYLGHFNAILSIACHLAGCQGNTSIQAQGVCNCPLLPTKHIPQDFSIQCCITPLQVLNRTPAWHTTHLRTDVPCNRMHLIAAAHHEAHKAKVMCCSWKQRDLQDANSALQVSVCAATRLSVQLQEASQGDLNMFGGETC